MNISRKHPFLEAKLSISAGPIPRGLPRKELWPGCSIPRSLLRGCSFWAPEEDTSVYYGKFQTLDEGVVASQNSSNSSTSPVTTKQTPIPPPGVDVGAFLRLIDTRRSGIADNLLTIDKAANNMSIVFSLDWRGWRLLFSGDAEIRSWKTMAQKQVLKPVHFLKVAHHGNHNGTPADEIFDTILPAQSPDGRNRLVAVSTWSNIYSGIPHAPTNARLS